LDEIKTLEARDTELASTEEEIRRERAEVRSRVNELNRALSIYRSVMGLPNASKPPAASELFPQASMSFTVGAQATRTIADIAEDYMAEHGGRAKVTDIVRELVRLKRLKGKHGDYGTVYGTLKRNERRFIWVGEGEFAVAGS